MKISRIFMITQNCQWSIDKNLKNLNLFYVLPFMLFDNVSILLVCIPLTRVAGPDPTSE